MADQWTPPRIRLDTSIEEILDRLASIDGLAAVATIVGTDGSTYRKAGARMLIESDGQLTGLLSGGCFEADLREHARRVLETGQPVTVAYDMRGGDDPVFGLGSGCEGAMRILIEAASRERAVFGALRRAHETSLQGGRAILNVTFQGAAGNLGTSCWNAGEEIGLQGEPPAAWQDAIASGESGTFRWTVAGVQHAAWIQVVDPLPRVLICGGGNDAQPVVAQLRALRLPVTVVDHRPALAVPARFPGASVLCAPVTELCREVGLDGHSAAIVMSHHLASDAAYLTALAQSAIPYVGLLGPRQRREHLLRDIGPCAAALQPRLRGPVGLDIGAVTPEGIALAIVAELHAFFAHRQGGPWTSSSDRGL
ncbi:MAG: XdhC family protein [Steroidobacteraceae bacterium]